MFIFLSQRYDQAYSTADYQKKMFSNLLFCKLYRVGRKKGPIPLDEEIQDGNLKEKGLN